MHTHFNLAKLHLALLPTHQLIWTQNEVHEGLGRRSHFSPPGTSNIEANHFTLWRTMEKRVRDVRKLIDGATIFVSVVTNLQQGKLTEKPSFAVVLASKQQQQQ